MTNASTPDVESQINAYLAERQRSKERLPTRTYLKEFISRYGGLPTSKELQIILHKANGRTHREDGPAVIFPYDGEIWVQDERPHREDGPAMIYEDGTRLWYRHGSLHREDGPAEMRPDGRTGWFLEGRRLEGLQDWFAENGIPHWTRWNDKHRIHFLLRWS